MKQAWEVKIVQVKQSFLEKQIAIQGNIIAALKKVEVKQPQEQSIMQVQDVEFELEEEVKQDPMEYQERFNTREILVFESAYGDKEATSFRLETDKAIVSFQVHCSGYGISGFKATFENEETSQLLGKEVFATGGDEPCIKELACPVNLRTIRFKITSSSKYLNAIEFKSDTETRGLKANSFGGVWTDFHLEANERIIGLYGESYDNEDQYCVFKRLGFIIG